MLNLKNIFNRRHFKRFCKKIPNVFIPKILKDIQILISFIGTWIFLLALAYLLWVFVVFSYYHFTNQKSFTQVYNHSFGFLKPTLIFLIGEIILVFLFSVKSYIDLLKKVWEDTSDRSLFIQIFQ